MRILFAITLLLAPLASAEPLAGTRPLTVEGDLGPQMVDGIDRYLLRKSAGAERSRATYWKRDTSSPQAYVRSVEPNRARLAAMLGVVDARIPFDAPQLFASTREPALVGQTESIDVFAVTWPVIGGVQGEGLLLLPRGRKPTADVVAIPDADQLPEMIAGLVPGIDKRSQFARRLAEAGCRVIVPTLADRTDEFSMPSSGQKTNQTHREYIYRPAFQMGRHVIGYEVQKVLAAVDWFTREAGPTDPDVAVIGYGEGGLLALYSGALDERIDVTCISGSFGPRDAMWQEPIYRNLFGYLKEFGDAEVASLIAPRKLVVDLAGGPQIDGPPPPRDGRKGAAPGKLVPVPIAYVEKELDHLRQLTQKLPPFLSTANTDAKDSALNVAALQMMLAALGREEAKLTSVETSSPAHLHKTFDPVARQKRVVTQMVDHTQALVRDSEDVRRKFMANADIASRDGARLHQSMKPYRQQYTRMIGELDDALSPMNPRSREIIDEPGYTGYDIMLDVVQDVFASGILLVPKDLKPGERRPVVVCQHGLDGRPENLADPKVNHKAYGQFAVELTKRGFITYSPQNPYIGGEQFRLAIRKANPLGLTLWSFILPQHQQSTDWLASLPFVDPDRIAFYGLSYGGKTAMRIPALLDRYCLSICSGDFNEWTWKTTSLAFNSGYPGTHEYEIFEWNLGHTFGYFEMAAMIAPRPFMVERGHRDGVAPDQWVAYEYAKVRRLYADLKIPERTEIEYFDGPHRINGIGTFRFLHKHLSWAEPTAAPPQE